MLFNIGNFGMVKQATIEIGSLSVIAGKNNCGKSSIGKLIFSLIIAISRYDETLREGKEERIKEGIRAISGSTRKFGYLHNIPRNELELLFEKLDLRNLSYDIREHGMETIGSRRQTINNIQNTTPQILKFAEAIDKQLQALEDIFVDEESLEELLNRTLSKVFYSEFWAEVEKNDYLNTDSTFSIKNKQDEEHIITITINKGKFEIECGEHINSIEELRAAIPFRDACLVESPFVLNVQDSIFVSNTVFESSSNTIQSFVRAVVPLHMIDLIRKLRARKYPQLEAHSERDSLNFRGIIDGEIKYDDRERDFIYITNTNQQHRVLNTASGIKAFGILQVLTDLDILSYDTLLILDEPEVHLHPEWQVKYAEILCKIIKQFATPVLVTTHSPYMFEALELYSKQEKISPKLYCAKKIDKDIVEFQDVEGDTSVIYKDLLQPLEDLDMLRYRLGE